SPPPKPTMKPALVTLMRTLPASASDGSVALASTTADANNATASLVKRARLIGALLCHRPSRNSFIRDHRRLDLDQIRVRRQDVGRPRRRDPAIGADFISHEKWHMTKRSRSRLTTRSARRRKCEASI